MTNILYNHTTLLLTAISMYVTRFNITCMVTPVPRVSIHTGSVLDPDVVGDLLNLCVLIVDLPLRTALNLVDMMLHVFPRISRTEKPLLAACLAVP